MSNTAYANPMPIALVIARLREATNSANHQSLDCGPSLLNEMQFDANKLLTSAQISDAYLLGIAVVNGHRFVTFDARISLQAVRGVVKENLAVI
jgi:uncharacterized protein